MIKWKNIRNQKPVLNRKIEEDDEKKSDEFKKKCQKYITFYNFLIQIYPIKNLNLKIASLFSSTFKEVT